jgi:hypothetical protein
LKIAPPLKWQGNIFKLVTWHQTLPGALAGTGQTCFESDLWTTAYLPSLKLPCAALENIWRAALNVQKPPDPARLLVESLDLLPGNYKSGGVIQGEPGGTTWSVADSAGQGILKLAGLSWQ